MGNSNTHTSTSKRKRNNSFRESGNKNTKMPGSILRTKVNPISDDYIIISKRELGTGISGKVILCQDKITKRKYALKRIKDSKTARREVDLQWRASQNFLHIVQIIDVYENKIRNENYLLVVMELCEGGELFNKIKNRRIPFTEHEVAKIMKQIITAVKHLHSMGIAHRDLKPENLLLLTKDDKNLVIKLCDFGFAKEAHKGLTTPNYTPYYVAPEILRFEKYDISCDIWSLGVIMYILCCGYPPFYSKTGDRISPGMEQRIKAGEYVFPAQEWSQVSREAKYLIKGMLETIPDKRMTIDDIINSDWMRNYSLAPKTELKSINILRKNDQENWKEVTEDISQALKEMRIDWDASVQVKQLNDANNRLYKRRKEKEIARQSLKSAAVAAASTTIATKESSYDNNNNDDDEDNQGHIIKIVNNIEPVVNQINKQNKLVVNKNNEQISSSTNLINRPTLVKSLSVPTRTTAIVARYYTTNLKEIQ